MRFSARLISKREITFTSISSQYVQIAKTEDWKNLKMEIRIKAYDKLMIQTLQDNTEILAMSEDV